MRRFLFNLLCVGSGLSVLLVTGPVYAVLVIIFSVSLTLTSNALLQGIYMLFLIPCLLSSILYCFPMYPSFYVFLFFLFAAAYAALSALKTKSTILFLLPGILSLSNISVFLVFWGDRNEKSLPSVLSQPGVRPVFLTLHSGIKLKGLQGKVGAARSIEMDPEEKALFVSFQHPPSGSFGVLRLSLDGSSPPRFTGAASYRDLFYLRNSLYVTLHDGKQVAMLDPQTLTAKQTIYILQEGLANIAYDPKIENLFVTSGSGYLEVVSIKHAKVIKEIKLNATVDRPVVNAPGRKLYLSHFGGMQMMSVLNMDTFKTEKTVGHLWHFAFGMTRDAQAHKLYIPETLWGNLWELNEQDLNVAKKVHVKRGLREVAVDTKRNLIYTGNFLTGELFILDRRTLAIKAVVVLGDKIRDIFVSPKRNRVFVSSILGVFELFPEEILDNRRFRQ